MFQTKHAAAVAVIRQRGIDAINAAKSAEQAKKAAVLEASREANRVKFRQLIGDLATSIDDALERLQNQGYPGGAIETLCGENIAAWPLLNEHGDPGRTKWYLLSSEQLRRKTNFWDIRNYTSYVTPVSLLENTLVVIEKGGDLQVVEHNLHDLVARCNRLAPNTD